MTNPSLPATTFQIYIRLLGYLRYYKGWFALGTVGALMYAAVGYLITILSKEFLDGTFLTHDSKILTLMPVFVVLLFTLRGGGECGTGEQPVIACAFAGLCYAEMASTVPISEYALGATTVAIDRGDVRRAKARLAGDGQPGRHPVAAGALVRGRRCRVPSRASSRMQPRRRDRLPQRAGRRREAL